MLGTKVKASVLCPGFVRTNIMSSERNRPADLVTSDRVVSEAERGLQAAYEDFVATGIPPTQVAERVFEAIRDERFYVFPHPELLEGVRSRMQHILARENPTFDLPEEMRTRIKM